jgi:hypothetical protein
VAPALQYLPSKAKKEHRHEHQSHPRVAHPRFVFDRHGVPGGPRRDRLVGELRQHRDPRPPLRSSRAAGPRRDLLPHGQRGPRVQRVQRPLDAPGRAPGDPRRGSAARPNSQTEIKVGAQAGAFTTLKLDATGGRSFIRQVYIQFENGQEQIIRNLDRTLTGNECLTLDLDGGRRQIHRVIVYGAQGAIGWRRAAGSFNVSAV